MNECAIAARFNLSWKQILYFGTNGPMDKLAVTASYKFRHYVVDEMNNSKNDTLSCSAVLCFASGYSVVLSGARCYFYTLSLCVLG